MCGALQQEYKYHGIIAQPKQSLSWTQLDRLTLFLCASSFLLTLLSAFFSCTSKARSLLSTHLFFFFHYVEFLHIVL
jgi:hypothetical protein